MRQVRYGVASSLDGYIAGPAGETDWILMDPEIDFAAIFARFDTLLLGRHTFLYTLRHGRGTPPGLKTVVFSRTLRQQDYPGVTITGDALETIATLRSQPGRDMWLMGGGQLFRTLLDAKQVDALDIAVLPVLLGDGVPILPAPYTPASLALRSHRVYSATGIVTFEYDVR